MKKKKLKALRQIANEMVNRGAPESHKLRFIDERGNTKDIQTIPINHVRRMKAMLKNSTQPAGKVIDTYVGKYFTVKPNDSPQTESDGNATT